MDEKGLANESNSNNTYKHSPNRSFAYARLKLGDLTQAETILTIVEG